MTGLIELAARHACPHGRETAIAGVTIWMADGPTAPIPALFEPEFYLLLQGGKRMTIAGQMLDVTAGTCAVASVGLPFTSQVIAASAAVPYLGIEVKPDVVTITDLLHNLPDDTGDPAGAISFAQVDDSILEPLSRLLGLLDAPAEIAVLARQYERELCYRLLQGPLGPRLRQLGHRTARFGQIRTAADWIARNADQPMSVEWLAGHVGMSVTSFHRHFRAVTSHTPLAYRQHIRLLDARRQLASGSANVTKTAFDAGYASASQFSREYKRAFGRTPVRDTARMETKESGSRADHRVTVPPDP